MRTKTVTLVLGFIVAAAATALAQDRPAGASQARVVAVSTDATPAPAEAKMAEGEKAADAQKKPPTADAKKDVKPAPPKPEPTGLEKLSADWPKWLKVGVLYRGRVESVRPVTGTVSDYDGYYMNRLRLMASVQASPWVQVVAQIHDAASMGYTTAAVPTSLSGGFDLRQGYVEVGRKGKQGVLVSGGRMELSLGDGRLIASPDWGNSSRTYDMGKVSAFVPGFRLDVFRAAPVQIDTAKFDRAKPGEYFWGAYASLDKVKKVTVIDVYAFEKANSVVTGELGQKGDARIYTYGGRIAGPIGKAFGYDFDAALQRGHMATDDVQAWAVHGAVSWLKPKSAVKPKLSVEYDFASGDANPKDGVKETFDQLYASNHAKYGFADLVGWRNMHAFELKFEVTPTKRVKLSTAINRLLLAKATDSWYGSSGSKVVLNAKATSRDIGWEPDVFATFAVSKELALSAGVAVLLPGNYVKQSTTMDRYWYPYAMWTVKF
jgi:hypothetical protein